MEVSHRSATLPVNLDGVPTLLTLCTVRRNPGPPNYRMLQTPITYMKKITYTPTLRSIPARQLRAELAAKIASLIGNEENRITEIPGVSLHRRTAPTPPCRTTYHPGIIVVAQGSKQVNLGKSSFIYDEAHYLLTAVDLPIVSWVAEATEEVPCLVLSLKLDISMVRELLSREEIHVADSPSDSPAMSIGETTPEFLSACCRLLDLLNSPQDIPFLNGLIQREIIYRILRGPRRRALALGCNTRRSMPSNSKSDSVDCRELFQDPARRGTRGTFEHGSVHAASPFPDADFDEPAPVSKATATSVGTKFDAEQRFRRRERRF